MTSFHASLKRWDMFQEMLHEVTFVTVGTSEGLTQTQGGGAWRRPRGSASCSEAASRRRGYCAQQPAGNNTRRRCAVTELLTGCGSPVPPLLLQCHCQLSRRDVPRQALVLLRSRLRCSKPRRALSGLWGACFLAFPALSGPGGQLVRRRPCENSAWLPAGLRQEQPRGRQRQRAASGVTPPPSQRARALPGGEP